MPFASSFISFVIIFFIALLGLALGSFASVLSYREARGLSWFSVKGCGKGAELTGGRSACTECKKALRAVDLIPVFSWLYLRGHCRYCASPIPFRYPLLELASMVLCVLAYIAIGAQPAAFILIAAVPFLLALVVIDLEAMILPDRLMAVLTALGLLKIGFLAHEAGGDVTLHYLLSAILYGGFAWALGRFMAFALKKEALGMGDVKFFALAGLWLGLAALPAFCVVSGLAGVIFAAGWRVMHKGAGAFPFGPALIASFYIMVVFGEYHFW